jgi:hypothetical protein
LFVFQREAQRLDQVQPRQMFAVACARRAVSTISSQWILRNADMRQSKDGRSTPWFSDSAVHRSQSQVVAASRFSARSPDLP